jgi:exodeoxyribonuclease VII large subunit
MRLSELNILIRNTLSDAFQHNTFWIIAELSNVNYYPAKNYYFFDLVEKEEENQLVVAKIVASAFGTGSQRIQNFERITGQKFSGNIQVLIQVSIDFHIVYGLKLILKDIDPSFTLGNLERQRQHTLLRLLKEYPDSIQLVNGEYITPNKRLTLPMVIQKIAVLSSENAAGYTDFVNSLLTNNFGYKFSLFPYFTTVQGENNTTLLVDKMKTVIQSGEQYDALVIIRGGGSQSDLLLFDQYEIAKEIAFAPIPIITGIGHHKDISIADLMANKSTNTPTKVAEMIIEHNHLFEQSVKDLKHELILKVNYILSASRENLLLTKQQIINKGKQKLQNKQRDLLIASHDLTTKPLIITAKKIHDLVSQKENLKEKCINFINKKVELLEHFKELFRVMDPVNTLKRGFAIVKKDAEIITHSSEIKIGEALDIQFYDGTVQTIVNNKISKNE